MQAAVFSVPRPLPLLKPATTSEFRWKSAPRLRSSRYNSIRAVPVPSDSSTVDYSSKTSVFPAEACETIGGDACSAEMYPEAKLSPETEKNKPGTVSENVDREYYEYNSPKTVFLGEACDDLGGEFCEADYQKEVY